MSLDVVCRDSIFAAKLRNEVLPFLAPATYFNSAPTTQSFYGSRNLFDASLLTLCACEILPMHFSSKPNLIENWELTNTIIRDRWTKAIKLLEGPQFLEQDYLAVDNEYYLQSKVHLVLRWDEKLIAVNFCYLPTSDLQKVKLTSARKRDVYQINAGIFLLNADSGVIIYEDGNETELFGIARSPQMFEAIKRKCQMMRDYLFLKRIPSCRCRRKKQNGE